MPASGFSDRNHRLLLALRHPLRRRILRLTSNEEAISPCKLADLLDEPLGGVSYHVKVLARCGALKFVRKERSKGSTQHFYRWSLKEEWAQKMLDEGEGKPPKDPS